MVDWSEIRSWVQLIFTLAVALWSWVATRHRVHVSQLRELEDSNADLERRVAIAEQALHAGPQRTEFERLSSDVRVVGARMDGFAREVQLWRETMQQQISRMDTFLRGRFE